MAPLRLLNLFIKSFFNPFVDIALTFSGSLFNLFSTSTCFVSFDETFLFELFSPSSKSVFYTKLAISLLLAKFTCGNLALKFSDDTILNF